MKLPYLRTRKYTNRAGKTWIGYYYEPPRGSGGEPGVRPKPVPLGDETFLKNEKRTKIPPPEVLAKYSEVAKVKIAGSAAAGTIAAVYDRWLKWAEAEVKASRLARRTLDDYEAHWKELEPVFGLGAINALSQPVLLQYFDRRTSKDRAKREVNFLGLLCAWARPRGMMQVPNPVDRGLRLQMKVARKLKPTVPADVYRVVWTCGDQLVRDVLDLSYMLATRPSEALGIPMPAVGATELEKHLPKTSKRGRSVVRIPITPELQAFIDRRRALRPNSLYLLFDDDGRQLLPQGMVRTRLYKAIKLAKKVCEKLEIKWVDLTRQQLRPTAITQVDKVQGREGARKLAGHTTEKQTADYIRHEAEEAIAAALPQFDGELVRRIEATIASARPTPALEAPHVRPTQVRD
jgi:integrase